MSRGVREARVGFAARPIAQSVGNCGAVYLPQPERRGGKVRSEGCAVLRDDAERVLVANFPDTKYKLGTNPHKQWWQIWNTN